MALHGLINEACHEKRLLKTIIGINNFSINTFSDKIKAAEVGGSTYLDIAANTDLLKEIKTMASIPVCVSSISVRELEACYDAGADMLELGNFDIFYAKNITFTPEQIIATVKKLRFRVPNASLCVTIPHTLDLYDQLSLAQHLEQLGVDMLQTEGNTSKSNTMSNLLDAVNCASATLSSTVVLSNYINIPIIASSGISSLTAPLAISCGACGVGVGSFFREFSTSLELCKEVSEMRYAMQVNHSLIDKSYKYGFTFDNVDILQIT
uniref:Uncharacterized protein ycf23 n=1 Tax=Helminthocladia australis TaxID=260093 RepID=A0A1G4NTN3_9FLOR|nr:Hypothetical protein ycf23 [Helminthocladia australis]SCW21916.1 Hypothetical protein ycf23 [Helminthocladia australis]